MTEELRKITGQLASDIITQQRRTYLVAGTPKLGKTTFALSGVREHEFAIVVSCDLGEVTLPPWLDRRQVLILPYHALTREMEGDGNSKPVKDVFLKLTGDLFEIYKSVTEGRPLNLTEGSFPVPQWVVLDGMSRLNNMLIDGQLAMNNMRDPGELDNKAFKFWGKRLRNTLTVVEQFASLPVNVGMTSWVEQTRDSTGVFTGVWYPDIGGKMDLLTAGTVSAAMLVNSRQGKYYVRVQPDGQYPWLGVRNRFGLPAEIDVTIGASTTRPPAGQTPWEKVFGQWVK